MSGTRKRGQSPVRFSNNSSRFVYNNYNRADEREEAARIKKYMPAARANVQYYKQTGVWRGPFNNMEREWMRRAEREMRNNNNNNTKNSDWTCGLYGCVKRFFGRGGTRRNRKQKTTLKRKA
jgi:hypothetical protein